MQTRNASLGFEGQTIYQRRGVKLSSKHRYNTASLQHILLPALIFQRVMGPETKLVVKVFHN